MPRWPSLLFTILLLGLSALTVLSDPGLSGQVPAAVVSLLSAHLAFTGLTLGIMLSTRRPFFIGLSGGFSRLTHWHRVNGILSGLLLLCSAVTAYAAGRTDGAVGESGPTLAAAALLFLLIIGLSLARRLPYEIWRVSHRMVLIVWLLVFWAMLVETPDRYGRLTPALVWAVVQLAAGFMAWIDIAWLRRRRALTATVTAVTYPSGKDCELVVVTERPVKVEAGQFFFVRVDQNGFERGTHPLSIGAIGDQVLSFVIRSTSGDWSHQVYEQVRVGDQLLLDGPYGELQFRHGFSEQVWVADGIGIVPFISCLRQLSDEEQRRKQAGRPSARDRSRLGELDNPKQAVPGLPKSILLYYSYPGRDMAAFRPQLEIWQDELPQLSVRFIDTSQRQRLEPDELIVGLRTSVFICGPRRANRRIVRFLRQAGKGGNLNYQDLNLH